jgi:hypothetical protein
LGANDSFEFIDPSNPCHEAVTRLLTTMGDRTQAVDGKSLEDYDFVNKAGVDAVQAFLADQDAALPVLDEWMRRGAVDFALAGCLGVTVAEGDPDFPSSLRRMLGKASLFRCYQLPEAHHHTTLPMLVMAFMPNGMILTANEPCGTTGYLNYYDGVRRTK